MYRTLYGTVNAKHDAAGGIHDGAQPGADGQDRRLHARRGAHARDRPGLGRRSAHHPGRSRHHALRRPPRSAGVPADRARDHAVERVRGHRQRRERGAALRPLPDPPRRQGDQGLRVGWRDVAHHRAGRAAVLRRGVRGDRRRGAPGGDPGGRARCRRLRGAGLHPGRHRLHRARLPRHRRDAPDDGRPRDVPGVDDLPHRGDGHRARRSRAAEEGGGDLSAGPGDVAQGHRRRA